MNTLAPGSLLGQLAPANTTAAMVFTASICCNVTSSPAKIRIFHDEAGTTYAVGNALWYDVPVPGNTTLSLDAEHYGGINLAGTDSLGVRTDTANAITFSVYGVVQVAK
jgi:hypothetical protein